MVCVAYNRFSLSAAFFIHILPAWSSIDEISVTETFTRRIFPELISLKTLATIRTVKASLVWAVSLNTIFFRPAFFLAPSICLDIGIVDVVNKLAQYYITYILASADSNLHNLEYDPLVKQSGNGPLCLTSKAKLTTLYRQKSPRIVIAPCPQYLLFA
jgi:hypothetical protein